MPRSSVRYENLEDIHSERDAVPWYWRFIALASSWMILGGYLILPAAYAHDPQLRFSKGVLSIIVVTIMTTGYSITALLCFACRNWVFQAESVFLPALTSSGIGLLTVLWSFASSYRFTWNTAAIVTTAAAAFSTFLYSVLLLLTNRKIERLRRTITTSQPLAYTDTAYKNFVVNMYPSATRPSHVEVPTEDELVNAQMQQLLRRKQEPVHSPEASRSTFRIDLPDDPSHETISRDLPLPANSSYLSVRQHQPRQPARSSTWDRVTNAISGGRGRSGHDPESRGRESSRNGSHHTRAVSREERRQEIEMGRM